MEIEILNFIQNIHNPVCDVIMTFVTKLGNGGAIWILAAIILFAIPKTRKSGAILVIALIIDVILCNGILKNLFCRIRPCNINTSVQLLITRPSDFSFPSGHTSASFAAVASLFFAKERKLFKPAFVLATLIAFSRMYLYVHYPTDILAGIVVGVLAGYMGYFIVCRLEKCKIKSLVV